MQFAQPSERINTARLRISVGGATEKSFRKIELLELEGEEEKNTPTDIDYDHKFDRTDLFCEEDDEKDYDLCSGCDENRSAHLNQPCGHMISTNCVKKNNCPLRGLYKLALSGTDRGHQECLCYFGRSKCCSGGGGGRG